MVDVSSNNRGEGLRYYLERDPVSKQLLDEYQENNRPTWKSAALSTLGTGMILGGFLRSNEGERKPSPVVTPLSLEAPLLSP